MDKRYERYKTQGDLSPLTVYSVRAGRIFVILLLLFICSRTVPNTSASSLVHVITMGEDYIVRANSSSFEKPFWPDAGLYAVWPDRVMYFDSELDQRHSRIFEGDDRFSADAHGYVQYSKTGTLISSITPGGMIVFEHRASAWPQVTGSANWILLYTGDQAGIAFLDRNRGQVVGEYQQFASIITASVLVDDDQNAVLGMMDGSIEKFNMSENRSLWRVKAPSGRLPVIKGLAAAPSQNGVFVVSGSDPEILSLIDQQGNVRWSRESAGDLRTQIMTFANEKFAVTHTADAVSILELDSKKELIRLIPPLAHEGRITWVSFVKSPQTGALYVSISKGANTALYHLSADGRVRSCRVINSPWAELTAAQNAGAIAMATREAISIYRNPEGL